MRNLIREALLRPIIRLACRLLFRIEFFGVENVPPEGPLIIAPNHVSYADPFWVSLPVRRYIYYMAWDQVFKMPILGRLLAFLGAFPIRLERFDRRAIRAARQVLQEGKAMMIFPEGGRTVDGILQPFKPGVSRLALTSGTAIVPVTINGGYEAWPPHRLLPRPRKVTITYHPPVAVQHMGDDADSTEIRAAARELSQRLRSVVASSLEPHYLPADEKVLRTEY